MKKKEKNKVIEIDFTIKEEKLTVVIYKEKGVYSSEIKQNGK